jgi:uncharacterized membrane protein (UPF0127 family)
LSGCQTRFHLVRADHFLSRLFGIHLLKTEESALLIPRCRCVHTFGVRAPLQLIFLSASGRVLSVQITRPTQKIYRFAQAASVLEIRGHQLAVNVDDYVFFHRTTHLLPAAEASLRALPAPSPEALSAVSAAAPPSASSSGGSSAPAGFSAVETLFALPILILMVMAVFQIGLLWHAKFSVTHAVNVAARNASLQHGSDAAIRDGLVQGLLPLSGKVQTLTDLPKGLFRSSAELAAGLAMGWIRWEVLSPTRQSFADWGEPPDRVLNPSAQASDLEIPSAPLPALAMRRKPRSGSRGAVDGLPVGAVSGQTLLDANTLKLHLQVGVPLQLPIVGNLLARSLAVWSGCALPSLNDSRDRIGALNFGVGGTPVLLSSGVACRALAARDLQGRWAPRWPVEASAVVRMHSNARQSLMTLRDRAQ